MWNQECYDGVESLYCSYLMWFTEWMQIKKKSEKDDRDPGRDGIQ